MATIAHLYRHPIKAHGREELASVLLSEAECLPFDRHWAVTHGMSKFDTGAPKWMPCANFERGARTPALMAITARFDETTGRLALDHPELGPIDFDPVTESERFLDWVRPISPEPPMQPVALVSAGRGMTDSQLPTVSLKNLASNAALSAHMGTDLSIHRWRGNVWLDDLPAWEEVNWIGRDLRIGSARLRVVDRIGRCKATTANPATGKVDADTLKGLRELVGVQDFGVYAVVLEGGTVGPGDRVELT